MRLRDLVTGLKAAEGTLAGHLDEVLSEREAHRLVESLRAAALHGPTRPQPHLGHTPGLRRLGFRLASLVDHALDAMESRPVHPVDLLAEQAGTRVGATA